MTEKPYYIGMIGLGTVGSGVLELLRRREADLVRRLGRPVEVLRIAVRNCKRPRPYLGGFGEVSDLLTENPAEVVCDPLIDLLVEVAGGIEEPRQWILGAIENQKDVVTANKAVLAVHGAEIFQQAVKNRRRVYYEASVAAALPIIEMLQNGLIANQITRLSAILNGTCNFILTRMEEDGLDYGTALKMAQEKGFAEADPTLDVGGIDAAHKLALLAGIITGSHVPIDRVFTEGIERITAEDFTFAKLFNYSIKLLGILKLREEGTWEMRVHPTLIPRGEILAQVRNELNGIALRGDAIGPLALFGKGAGSLPTASSIVADIFRAARGEKEGGNPHGLEPPSIAPMGDVHLRHYVRLKVLDFPGVLGRITSFFGMRGISIASIQQPEAKMGMPVPIVLLTHVSPDRVVTETLRDIENAKLVQGTITRIRLEDLS
ncbi:MAG: homoserine dehydrogenase [Planctomycetes bacterium]|nr:homoserine dehydrogenase [Planctomycetota bacterium]